MSTPAPGGPARPARWSRHEPAPRAARPLGHEPLRPHAAPAVAPPRRLRILLVNQYYWPDHASTAQHLADLAEALVEQGHDVHVLCSRRGSKPGSPARPRRETHRGVTIHRVGATALGRRSTLRRMADYLSFHAGAATRALTLPRFDVAVTLTTPPLIGLLGTALRARGTRHVAWSMDLHPDASIALGRMSNRKRGVRLLQWLSDEILRRADRVVTLGPYMSDRALAKGVDPARVTTIPVWSRRDEVYPLPREGHPLRAALGLDGKFVVMYSGNHGLAHRFEEFLDAARRLAHRDDIAFLFVGDGPRAAEVEAACTEGTLPNLRRLDFFPRDQLHASLSVADAHLVSLRPEMVGVCVPGKLYGAMASGRPVLFVGPAHCEVADTIREARCGATFLPGEGAALADTISRLAADPDEARALGDNGLAAFVAEFERDACCARWCWMLADLDRNTEPAPRDPRTAPAPAIAPSAPLELAR